MENFNIKAYTRVMKYDEYIGQLKDKLLEEANEVVVALDDEVLGELADVLEVMIAIGRTIGVELSEIITEADQRRAKRGGFGRMIYASAIDVCEDSECLQYYQNNPRYKECDAENDPSKE